MEIRLTSFVELIEIERAKDRPTERETRTRTRESEGAGQREK